MSIRCLVVDDSPTMRAMLTALLSRDSEIEVVGSAHDAHMAREMIRELDPDVITLDIEMPHMNGLDFLERLMRLRPTPVVMCSSLTKKGADATLRALELGAIDCYAKPAGGLHDVLATDDGTLAEMVKQAARSRRRTSIASPVVKRAEETFHPNGKIVAIGASTGGVEALMKLLQGFPANCPPTVIVQHMPATFTSSFAARLDSQCPPRVTEAVHDEPLKQGHVYVAPGGLRHLMIRGSKQPTCKLIEANPVSGHRPSVDVLFRSVVQTAGDAAVGVILTGMGRDGAAGLLEMRDGGCRTIGQNEASCVVYGMPRAAHEIGAVEDALPLDRISKAVLDLCSR